MHLWTFAGTVMASDGDRGCFEAIQHADLRKLSSYLRTFPESPFLVHNSQGLTLLHAAALSNNHLVVCFLLEALSKSPNSVHSVATWIDSKAPDGSTALHIAAGHGNTVTSRQEMIDALVRYGGDVEAQTGEGAVALHFATQGNHPKAMLHLIEQYHASIYALDGQGKNAVHRGAYFGADCAVELLLALDKAEIFPNSLDCNSNSPLHYAVLSGVPKVVRVLLASKADPYAVDLKGRSPFSMAKTLQFWNIVELISAPPCKMLIGHRPPVKKNDGKCMALILYFVLFLFLASYTLFQSWSLWYLFLCTSELLTYFLVSFKDPGYLSPPTSTSLSVLPT